MSLKLTNCPVLYLSCVIKIFFPLNKVCFFLYNTCKNILAVIEFPNVEWYFLLNVVINIYIYLSNWHEQYFQSTVYNQVI